MSSYILFIGYIVNVVYAFMHVGVVVGFINILVPYALMWDIAMFIGTH
jgi:hypothetical protein